MHWPPGPRFTELALSVQENPRPSLEAYIGLGTLEACIGPRQNSNCLILAAYSGVAAQVALFEGVAQPEASQVREKWPLRRRRT